MFEILRKTARLCLDISGKKYEFFIKQGTFDEVIEYDYYLNKSRSALLIYIFGILEKLNKKFKVESLEDMPPKEVVKILSFFQDIYCKGFYVKEKPEKAENTKKKTLRAPFNGTMAFIFENSNETTHSLKNMTREQIHYLSDGIVRNLNNKSKEGRLENIRNTTKKDIESGKYDETLNKLKENRKKLMKKYGKKAK